MLLRRLPLGGVVGPGAASRSLRGAPLAQAVENRGALRGAAAPGTAVARRRSCGARHACGVTCGPVNELGVLFSVTMARGPRLTGDGCVKPSKPRGAASASGRARGPLWVAPGLSSRRLAPRWGLWWALLTGERCARRRRRGGDA